MSKLFDGYGEAVLTGFNLLVGYFNVVGLEGRSPEEKRITDDSCGPDVDLIGVSDCAFDDFWCNIVRGPAHGPFLLLCELQLSGESEVANLNFHVSAEKDVAKFEVAMYDAVGVHVLNSGNDLDHEVAGFLGGEPLPALDHFAERLAGRACTLQTQS